MTNSNVKFKFLKTPQIGHKFRTHSEKYFHPNIKTEVFFAIFNEGFYEFSGMSSSGKFVSGKISEENFIKACSEGFISIINDE